jgi:tyrosinase
LFETWHDIIHVIVGGEDGFLGDPNYSGRETAFWLHHCNVDRLWKRWLDQGGRYNPVNDANWMNMKFTFFDENGKSVEMAVKDCLSTEYQLGYRYDDDPPPVPRKATAALSDPSPLPVKPQRILATNTDGRVKFSSKSITVALDIGKEAQNELAGALLPGSGASVLLNIEEVVVEKEMGTYFEVYLNLPRDVKEPDYQSAHYLGNLVFVGLKPQSLIGHKVEGDQQPNAATRTYNITDVVPSLKARKLWNENQLTVTFVMRGLVPPKGMTAYQIPEPKARFGRVSLARS